MEREHRHLDLGKGSAHPVGIDYGQTHLDRSRDRHQGVDAPHLDWHQGDGFLAQIRGQSIDARSELGACGDLLQDHGRRANDCSRQNPSLVGQFVDVHDLGGSVISDRLLDQELAHVGVTTATGAQQRRSEREVVDVVEGEFSHAHPSAESARQVDQRMYVAGAYAIDGTSQPQARPRAHSASTGRASRRVGMHLIGYP